VYLVAPGVGDLGEHRHTSVGACVTFCIEPVGNKTFDEPLLRFDFERVNQHRFSFRPDPMGKIVRGRLIVSRGMLRIR